MRTVRAGNRFDGIRVSRVEKLDRFHELRPGVVETQRVAFRETFIQARLQRVIPRIAFVGRRVDVAELRIRLQQL